jgi:hypothetical protein
MNEVDKSDWPGTKGKINAGRFFIPSSAAHLFVPSPFRSTYNHLAVSLKPDFPPQWSFYSQDLPHLMRVRAVGVPCDCGFFFSFFC